MLLISLTNHAIALYSSIDTKKQTFFLIITQPCRKSSTSTLRYHPVPDYCRWRQETCSIYPRRARVHHVAPHGREGGLQKRRSPNSTLVPVTSALVRRLMQLSCPKKVPSGGKVRLPRAMQTEPAARRRTAISAGATPFQEAATRGDGGGRRARREWSQSSLGRRLRCAAIRLTSFGHRRW